ncbi:hypothetical protein NQ318_014702 [Aromia moschata]|uniref:Uncharacterized protein n=1 Tax=Aromia moschata TaxID=1265417 RepID=A0AAV8ZDP6_9CUCU|nr:hypothetical protein NQ318_014702 [Aromia moschata]
MDIPLTLYFTSRGSPGALKGGAPKHCLYCLYISPPLKLYHPYYSYFSKLWERTLHKISGKGLSVKSIETSGIPIRVFPYQLPEKAFDAGSSKSDTDTCVCVCVAVAVVETCRALKQQHETDPDFLLKVITGDESWCYGYDPETKQQSNWKIRWVDWKKAS